MTLLFTNRSTCINKPSDYWSCLITGDLTLLDLHKYTIFFVISLTLVRELCLCFTNPVPHIVRATAHLAFAFANPMSIIGFNGTGHTQLLHLRWTCDAANYHCEFGFWTQTCVCNVVTGILAFQLHYLQLLLFIHHKLSSANLKNAANWCFNPK